MCNVHVKKKNKLQRETVEIKQDKNVQRFDKFNLGHTSAQQNYNQFCRNVKDKHKAQAVNTKATKQVLYDLTQQHKEINTIRMQEANQNKFKEDLKYDNFKRHVISNHSQQTL